LTVDEYNKFRLLYIYYSTANKNTEEVSMWKKISVTLDEKGILEKEMYLSKQDLKTKNLWWKTLITLLDYTKNTLIF